MSLNNLEPQFHKAYLALLEKFNTNPFTFEEAEKVLEEASKSLGVKFSNKKEVLSELEKAGLLEKRPYEKDKRKKIYRLKENPVLKKEKLGKDELINLLKEGADIIRTAVDYKVLLLFLFYKAVSDKYLREVKKLQEERPGVNIEKLYKIANTRILNLYDTDNNKLLVWHEVKNEPAEFINALNRIVELNRDKLNRLDELIKRTGLPSLFEGENSVIVKRLINLFSRVDFSEFEYDILGDAYEWILYYFAPSKAKEGEVYTPIEVSRLIANLIEPQGEEIILDPACGSASMLIEQYLYAKKKDENTNITLIGQERNEVTAVLAELNFILHGIKNAKVFIGDSLLNPKFEEYIRTYNPDGEADKVVANPPWNQKKVYNETTLKQNPKHRDIFEFGYTTDQSADWAWIQLINYYAKKKAGIVIDSGALFRGGREKSIRENFVKKDLIDCVILLPEKIFYNTQAPGVIIILNKEKPEERKNKVLFINASKEYIPHPEEKKLNKLSDENIKKIAEAYREFKELEGFSRIVDTDEIKRNEYNLNVSLYVSPIDEEEKIDLNEEFRKLEELNREYTERFKKVEEYIREVLRIFGGLS
ncbi:SAM-dependent methyltransferase [Aquifex pyrophilus]